MKGTSCPEGWLKGHRGIQAGCFWSVSLLSLDLDLAELTGCNVCLFLCHTLSFPHNPALLLCLPVLVWPLKNKNKIVLHGKSIAVCWGAPFKASCCGQQQVGQQMLASTDMETDCSFSKKKKKKGRRGKGRIEWLFGITAFLCQLQASCLLSHSWLYFLLTGIFYHYDSSLCSLNRK